MIEEFCTPTIPIPFKRAPLFAAGPFDCVSALSPPFHEVKGFNESMFGTEFSLSGRERLLAHLTRTAFNQNLNFTRAVAFNDD